MGNEESVYNHQKEFKVRHRTLDPSNPSNQSRVVSRRSGNSRRVDDSFATPPINNSFSRNLKELSEDDPEEEE